ncbi:uncharacterized protein L201_006077 [Kwoniella dendrophila CBS 6074]|uniref:Protein kinase domain-containing protein n=1 Tax=Kwoniella dendrophila CBS 6074 TaxID=1295534 RepID=A0AAX4K063_9TREE
MPLQAEDMSILSGTSDQKPAATSGLDAQRAAKFAQPGFNPDFAEIDVFHLIMSPELESERIGWSSKDFLGKAFSRIVPPYTPIDCVTTMKDDDSLEEEEEEEDDDDDEIEMMEGSLVDEDASRFSSLIDSSSNPEDPHLYLRSRNNIEIKWEIDYPLNEWIMPTKRDSWRIISSQEDNDKVLFLRIYHKVHAGGVWDIFRGDMRLRNRTGLYQTIILKLTKFNSFRDSTPENEYEWSSETDPFRTAVIDEVITEDWVLRQHLGSVQGDLVPYYYGMFVWHEAKEEDEDENNWIIASIMEDVGDPLPGGMLLYPLEVKQEIFRCFKRLHDDVDLVHGFGISRHVLDRDVNNKRNLGIQDRYALVDFKSSTSLQSLDTKRRHEKIAREEKVLLWELMLAIDGSGEVVNA